MRSSIHDYALKFEEATELTNDLKRRGFGKLPSSRLRQAHWPSDLTDCLRKRYYSFKGVDETNPTGFQGECVFAFGSLADDLIVKMMIRARRFVEDEYSYELRVPELTYPISGRIDIVIEEEDGTNVPVEVKTVKNKGFYDREWEYTGSDGHKHVKRVPGAISEPKLANVAQLMTYIYHMGTQHGYLVYINKDNQAIAIHKVYWSEELWNDTIKEAGQLESYLKLDTVPPRPTNQTLQFYKRDATYGKKGDLKDSEVSWPCGYQDGESGEFVKCRWFDHCWSDEILNNPDAGEGIKSRVKLALEAHKVKQKKGGETSGERTTLLGNW